MSSEKKKMDDYANSMNAEIKKQKAADDLAAKYSKAMSERDLLKANRLPEEGARAHWKKQDSRRKDSSPCIRSTQKRAKRTFRRRKVVTPR